jgi:hypothetical protein
MLNRISTYFSGAEMGRKEGKNGPEGPLFIDKISIGTGWLLCFWPKKRDVAALFCTKKL